MLVGYTWLGLLPTRCFVFVYMVDDLFWKIVVGMSRSWNVVYVLVKTIRAVSCMKVNVKCTMCFFNLWKKLDVIDM